MKITYNKSGRALQISKETNEKDINIFLKRLYYEIDLDYPKFFKMDVLCKIGLIGTEMIVRKNRTLFDYKSNVGVILQNKFSSLDTDYKHQERIQNKNVSPAVFVYTLPNIVIGEISIRHNWESEGVFLIGEEMDYELLSQYSNILIKEKRTEVNLIGWIDYLKNDYSLKIVIIDTQITPSQLKESFS
tara:strand:- start:130 stop:693 length:564 start_codon:yes stop_codon:yes gene_type:complete